jgi:glycosyltransferase involved in cell wall biosynthesis
LQKEVLSKFNKKIKVLHITPHVGGGVGKALLGVISEEKKLKLNIEHKIISLEKPKKNIFKGKNFKKIVSRFTTLQNLKKEIQKNDIIQIEFWNNPLIPWLLSKKLPKTRMVFWCHILGIKYPKIPKKIFEISDKFFCTSNATIKSYSSKKLKKKMSFISSAGGLDKLNKIHKKKEIKICYVGTLNFSKLNKEIYKYINAIPEKKISIDFFGDTINKQEILKNLKANVLRKNIKFHGYSKNLKKILKNFNVMLYLLNKNHYGTGENALVEAMAMGIIPIVMSNPTEKSIVKHLRNGIIIDNVEEFKKMYIKLKEDFLLRDKISKKAIKDVKLKYSYRNSALQFSKEYKKLIKKNKTEKNFVDIFGNKPYEWFLSFTDLKFKANKTQLKNFKKKYLDTLMDTTKGSPNHFLRYFRDKRLNKFMNY